MDDVWLLSMTSGVCNTCYPAVSDMLYSTIWCKMELKRCACYFDQRITKALCLVIYMSDTFVLISFCLGNNCKMFSNIYKYLCVIIEDGKCEADI